MKKIIATLTSGDIPLRLKTKTEYLLLMNAKQ